MSVNGMNKWFKGVWTVQHGFKNKWKLVFLYKYIIYNKIICKNYINKNILHYLSNVAHSAYMKRFKTLFWFCDINTLNQIFV